jgi:hypothetical protein
VIGLVRVRAGEKFLQVGGAVLIRVGVRIGVEGIEAVGESPPGGQAIAAVVEQPRIAGRRLRVAQAQEEARGRSDQSIGERFVLAGFEDGQVRP